jgi:hypothetical protein
MGRLGTFVPRLVALTAVWLLATTALTYAAAQRMSTPTATPAATTATTAAAPRVLVVPDVRHQAYVFAKGSLGDAGFAWHVVGGVQGYPANPVVSQVPAAGTRVIDTGAPLVVLRLQRASGKQDGIPEAASTIAGTAVRLADLATAAARPAATPKTRPKVPAKVAAPTHRAPVKHPQQQRPPAFVVAGARREPLDEIPLTARAGALLRWIDKQPKATDANVKYWLYQHAWIVTGAEMGWWHGDTALKTLTAVDRRVWELWGIGAASKQQADAALASVRAKEAK